MGQTTWRVIEWDGRDEPLNKGDEQEPTGWGCSYPNGARGAIYLYPKKDKPFRWHHNCGRASKAGWAFTWDEAMKAVDKAHRAQQAACRR
jgi:hypothetical protein